MGYEVVKPQGAFYIFPQAPITDDTVFSNELKEMRILVVLGSGFKAPGYFRLSYCCIDDKTIQGSFAGLKKALKISKNSCFKNISWIYSHWKIANWLIYYNFKKKLALHFKIPLCWNWH